MAEAALPGKGWKQKFSAWTTTSELDQSMPGAADGQLDRSGQQK